MDHEQKSVLVRIVSAAVLTAVLHFLPLQQPLNLLAHLVPYLLVGAQTLVKAAKGICKGRIFGESFLMSVASLGALLLGDYAEAVAVLLFYNLGELLEDAAVDKSRNSIRALMDIRPDTATLETDRGERTVSPEQVLPGSVILVKPGERIALDGIVAGGTSTLNTSALTGESLPRSVQEGDEVFSGCVNLSGVLHIRTTRPFGESTVSKVLELAEHSAEKKAQTEHLITRFARIYTPAVCSIALALALFVPLFRMIALGLSPDFALWCHRALTALVISCPCALVVSIPLGFFGGIGGASAHGILVKGASNLELLSRASTVVFDKTGTLTQGVFSVASVHPVGVSRETLLTVAAHAEYYSAHPIAQSLREACPTPLSADSVEDVQEIAGEGTIALYDGKRVAVGNDKLLQRLNIPFTAEGNAATALYVAIDGIFAGTITVSDKLKAHAKLALQALRAQGVKKTVLLSGDRQEAVAPVAKELDFDEAYSELLPQDKVAQVERLLAGKQPQDCVVFVGDGINDAPVLARADVGVAMGALGSDAAIEAADVVIMDDDPARIALAMRIARRTLRIIRQNIAFSLFVKIACLVAGALDYASLWLALFADVGILLLTVLNASRALHIKE